MPRISIIVPVYNVQDYLSGCIESILAQTFKEFEVILVNDGSCDDSGRICDEFAKTDRRIKVIHKKNEGVSKARNAGIEIAAGKYIMFADSDDSVQTNWCETMYDVISNDTKSLVVCGVYIVNKRSKREEILLRLYNAETENNIIQKKDFFKLYERQLLNQLWNKIFVAKIIKDNNIRFNPVLSLGEDLLFVLDYIKSTEDRIKIINKPLYNYFLRDVESLDNKFYPNLYDIYKLLYSEIYKTFIYFGGEKKTFLKNYHTFYFGMVYRVLSNTFNKKSPLSFKDRIKYNSNIIRSVEFQECLEIADLSNYNKNYLTALKTKNYFFVWLLLKINSVRKLSLNLLKNKEAA